LCVAVTATDSSGSNSATSAQTAVVSQQGPQGAIKLQNGATSIPATSVNDALVKAPARADPDPL